MITDMLWWCGFVAFVLAMLALDLGVFHRKAHEVKTREALIWTGAWVFLALAKIIYTCQSHRVANDSNKLCV